MQKISKTISGLDEDLDPASLTADFLFSLDDLSNCVSLADSRSSKKRILYCYQNRFGLKLLLDGKVTFDDYLKYQIPCGMRGGDEVFAFKKMVQCMKENNPRNGGI
jgi:hypothetical protein